MKAVHKQKHKPLPPHVQSARKALKDKGYNYRSGAKALGCCWQHLAKVMVAIRESKSLIQRIHALPVNPDSK